MEWDSKTQHHPFCNLFGGPREGCRQCKRLYEEYSMSDPDIGEPHDLMHKFFPDVVDVTTGQPVGPKEVL